MMKICIWNLLSVCTHIQKHVWKSNWSELKKKRKKTIKYGTASRKCQAQLYDSLSTTRPTSAYLNKVFIAAFLRQRKQRNTSNSSSSTWNTRLHDRMGVCVVGQVCIWCQRMWMMLAYTYNLHLGASFYGKVIVTLAVTVKK